MCFLRLFINVISMSNFILSFGNLNQFFIQIFHVNLCTKTQLTIINRIFYVFFVMLLNQIIFLFLFIKIWLVDLFHYFRYSERCLILIHIIWLTFLILYLHSYCLIVLALLNSIKSWKLVYLSIKYSVFSLKNCLILYFSRIRIYSLTTFLLNVYSMPKCVENWVNIIILFLYREVFSYLFV